MRIRPWLMLGAGLLFLMDPRAWAYDQVQVEKIVPFVDKKVNPSVLRLSPNKELWIINRSKQAIQKISEDGRIMATIKSEKKNLLFKNPVDFAFLKTGDLVIADAGLNRIAIVGFPESAAGDAQNEPEKRDWSRCQLLHHFPVESPSCVSVSHDDVIAVGGDKAQSVQFYSIDGIFLHQLTAPDKHPIKQVGSLAFSPDGVLWVSDGSTGDVHRFSPDRKWLGVTEDLDSSVSLAVDDHGFAYVVLEKGRWKEINRDGVVGGTFGTKGKNPGQFINPVGIAAPDHERVWVADAGNGRLQLFRVANKEKKAKLFPEPSVFIQVRLNSKIEGQAQAGLILPKNDMLLLNRDRQSFEWVDLEGAEKGGWGKKSKKTFLKPHSLTLDAAESIWITDQGDHTIKKFSESGELLQTIGQKGRKEGNLLNPSFLQIRDDASFVVVDSGDKRIQVLSPKGLFQFSVGSRGKSKGQFEAVAGLAVNSERIAVIDNERQALLFFDSNGRFISEVANVAGKTPIWKDLSGLASDRQGRFYALDKGSRRVRIFTPRGQFLADFNCGLGQHLFAGADQKVVVMAEKEIAAYTVGAVPRSIQNVVLNGEAGDIRIDWEAHVDAREYRVFRSTDAGGYGLVATVSSTTFTDSKVIPSVTYSYIVAGVNGLGYQGNSSEAKSIKAMRRKDVSLVSIEAISFDPVFTAAFKSYVDKPVGKMEIQNNDEKPFRDVKISILLKNYTDFATEQIVKSIGAGEKLTVPLTMTFNDKVLELTENTPVQVDVRLAYFEENQEKSVSQNAPLTLYSRNAISWTDKARINSFITPRDAPIVEFSRTAVRAFLPQLKAAPVAKPLAKAALLYESLNALKMAYVPDPKTPFAEVSGRPDTLDFVQFPRETLRRKTGDCDDTTALLASLLESIGVEVALIDLPGHILLMANLEENDPDILGLPTERFVDYNGTFWVPIETTQLGRDFLDAWQAGISKVRAAQEKGAFEFVRVIEAAEKHPPVTLVEVEKEPSAYPEDLVKASFPKILEQMQSERYKLQIDRVEKLAKQEPNNKLHQIQLGMIHVEAGKTEKGEQIFASLMSDSSSEVRAAALNNLGNLAFLSGKYDEAARHYAKAASATPEDGGILVNQARTAWRKGNKLEAKKLLAEAKNAMADWREYAGDMPSELFPQ